jgi:hypothetical protein
MHPSLAWMVRATTGLGLLLIAAAVAGQEPIEVTVTRLPDNPIISLSSSETLGNKINGPSVIRVPSWIENPLGRYYLYFAHHKGRFIRLAYADTIAGPWRVYEPGTLHLDQVNVVQTHIASPDVHVDDEARVIRMYFHGSRPKNENQKTTVATSTDGLRFTPSSQILGDAYFRVFRHDGHYYAIDTHGFLNRSEFPDRNWTRSENPLIAPVVVDDQYGRRSDVRIRHSAVRVQGDTLYLFYTRKADAPERILLARIPLQGSWSLWKPDLLVEVMRPETEYEGISYPALPSKKGGATQVQQLRDPYVFEDEGRLFLFYAIAGEMGIAVAEITIGE